MSKKKTWLLYFLLFSIFLCPVVSSESLLPDLDEVYGIIVPSFITTTGKYPDKISIEDENTILVFSDVASEEYYAYGTDLENAGCTVSDYSVHDQSISVTIAIKKKTFSFVYNSADSTMTIVYPEGIHDEVYHAMELTYQEALESVNEGKYVQAIKALNKIPDYEKTPYLRALIQYKVGLEAKERGDFKSAIKHLRSAKEYPETQMELTRLYNSHFVNVIKSCNYIEAEEIIQYAIEDNIIIDSFVCYQPGDTGENVYDFLSIVREIGYIKKPDTTYSDQYLNSIIEMENRLGLTADGIIYSDELFDILSTVYPGCKSKNAKMILEHLADAGYINGLLPESHDTYDQKYVSAILKAKKACGLNDDRILSKSEVDTIMTIPILEVAPVTDIRVKSSDSNYTIVVSWKASKNALFYEIYDKLANETLVGKVNGTSYTINYDRNSQHQYSVKARNYEFVSQASIADPVWAGPPNITIHELLTNTNEYKNSKIWLGSDEDLFVSSAIADNNTLYILVAGESNDHIYLRLNNYKSLGYEVRSSLLYNSYLYSGKKQVEYVWCLGKLASGTRRDSKYGEVYVINVSELTIIN